MTIDVRYSPDSLLFFGAKINPRLDQLWLQDGGYPTTVKPLSEHSLVKTARDILAGRPTSEIRNVMGPMSTAEYATLIEAIRKGFDPSKPISVAINHRGQCVITDGSHRASAALALGLATIPATIVYRSEEWLTLKNALYSQNKGCSCYQRPDHPDLDSWGVWRRDTENRAKVIQWYICSRHMPTGLDLACNSGLLTCALARKGHLMTGLDTDPACIATARALAPMHTIGAMYDDECRACFSRCDSVVDLGAATFDFIVCLSLLNHHQVDGRDEEGHEIFRRLVRASPTIILDAPAPGDAVGGSSKYIDPKEVIAWCQGSQAPGQGKVIQERGQEDQLMRTLIAWERDEDE